METHLLAADYGMGGEGETIVGTRNRETHKHEEETGKTVTDNVESQDTWELANTTEP